MSAGSNSPDIEVMWFPVITGDLSSDPPKGNGLTVGALVLKSEGTGEITLKSTTVYDQPSIDFKCV
jgi:choline dehydrogenase